MKKKLLLQCVLMAVVIVALFPGATLAPIVDTLRARNGASVTITLDGPTGNVSATKATLATAGPDADSQHVLPNVAADNYLLEDAAQDVTNKTIRGDNNTITQLSNSAIATNAAIEATKIADGSVNNTEYQHIGTLSSNAQTQLDGKGGLAASNVWTNTNEFRGVLNVNVSLGGELRAAKIKPSATQEHTVPAVFNDVFLLEDAAQDVTGKTLLANQNWLYGTKTDIFKIGTLGTSSIPAIQFCDDVEASALNAYLYYHTGQSAFVFGVPDEFSPSADYPVWASYFLSNSVRTLTVGPSATNQHTLPNVASDTVTLNAAAQTLSNKSISGASNTLSNIDAASVADGSVSNAEYQYLNGVTSALQTQLDATQPKVRGIATFSSSDTVGLTHDVVLLDCGSASVTATLPTAASATGRSFTFILIDNAGGAGTIDGNGTELIKGSQYSGIYNAQTLTLSFTGDWVTLLSDGTQWWMTAGGFSA